MTTGECNFTGVVLPVFFVKDTLDSLRFYRDVCGFSVAGYFDDKAGEEVEEWTRTDSPLFVRLQAGPLEFALHLNKGDFEAIGGAKHYFEVRDVDRQHELVLEQDGDPTDIHDLPWMRLFAVSDPDGHRLFFQTPNPEWRRAR
ncbi:VOC family protein [Candidatus Bipolaricaulota bacterium]